MRAGSREPGRRLDGRPGRLPGGTVLPRLTGHGLGHAAIAAPGPFRDGEPTPFIRYVNRVRLETRGRGRQSLRAGWVIPPRAVRRINAGSSTRCPSERHRAAGRGDGRNRACAMRFHLSRSRQVRHEGSRAADSVRCRPVGAGVSRPGSRDASARRLTPLVVEGAGRGLGFVGFRTGPARMQVRSSGCSSRWRIALWRSRGKETAQRRWPRHHRDRAVRVSSRARAARSARVADAV